MPANAVERHEPVSRLPVAHAVGSPGGWVRVNPGYLDRLVENRLLTPAALLDLPGEVVSGHPDRHVVRVVLPVTKQVCYLKRQHRVGWRERVRHAVAGLGRVSRCEHEARVLADLTAAGFRCPEWLACGEHDGRAFLLVEELPDTEVRKLLGSGRLAVSERRLLSEQLGRHLAELHCAGFVTPDVTAKHVFVDPVSMACTLIDWQSARRTRGFRPDQLVRNLAALDASLAAHLAGVRDRLRFLWAYRRVARRLGRPVPSFPELVRTIGRQASAARKRRSIRDQNQSSGATPDQRLVWLADEAVCAVPDVAAVWPEPAAVAPFYGSPDGSTVRIRLADGRLADLVRGRSVAPLGQLAAWWRGRSWRSPGVTIGRILFHLQRYGIPAPRLMAFGQRATGRATAEWFVLFEPPAGRPLAEWLAHPAPPALRRDVLDQTGRLLRQMHDAGCRYSGTELAFRVDDETGRVLVGDPRAVRIVKRVTAHARRAELLRTLPGLSGTDRALLIRGYDGP